MTFVLASLLLVSLLASFLAPADPPALVHTQNSFEFRVNAPMDRAFPLFGPEGERPWAGKSWNPVFLHPRPAHDVEGAVFTIEHPGHTAIWVNTAFDPHSGHAHYVYFIPEVMVTNIDVQLRPTDPAHTQVHVTYERTALTPTANATVEHLARQDANAGPEWSGSIDRYLSGRKSAS